MDLSDYKNCIKLFNKYKDIDLLVNNAGFGLYGEFVNTNLDACKHTLLKGFLVEP